MKNKKGSTIVWAITLIMVLVVIVGASLSFAYMSYNQSIKNRNKTQVELIANSAIKSLTGAIENDENSSQLIPDTGKQINVSKMECSVPYGTISNIKINRKKENLIIASLKANYHDEDYTIYAYLTQSNNQWKCKRYDTSGNLNVSTDSSSSGNDSGNNGSTDNDNDNNIGLPEGSNIADTLDKRLTVVLNQYYGDFKNIYTFGPTFRAENSNTKTHASEFWMIEPEMAFCELDRLMDVEEDMLRYIIKYVMENAYSELKFFDNFVHKGLIDRLNTVLNAEPKRITHKEAITILKESGKDFENKPEYGEDLAKEHEKYLTEEYFKAPVFVTDWPKDIKAFYMRLNDDNETVAAVDFLVPQAGELMGGSQREERYSVLKNRMDNLKMDEEELDWYLKLRQYGGVKHSGFGLGFERLLIYLTGMENIRDVIPFPRTPGNCEF